MKAPEKIYIDADENWHRSHSAFKEKAKENDIEYVRIDAFIEKACEYFAPHITDNSGGYARAYVFEEFKNYMKEE